MPTGSNHGSPSGSTAGPSTPSHPQAHPQPQAQHHTAPKEKTLGEHAVAVHFAQRHRNNPTSHIQTWKHQILHASHIQTEKGVWETHKRVQEGQVAKQEEFDKVQNPLKKLFGGDRVWDTHRRMQETQLQGGAGAGAMGLRRSETWSGHGSGGTGGSQPHLGRISRHGTWSQPAGGHNPPNA